MMVSTDFFCTFVLASAQQNENKLDDSRLIAALHREMRNNKFFSGN